MSTYLCRVTGPNTGPNMRAAPGGELTTTLALTQGEYVVLCVPQLARGMIQILRVASAGDRTTERGLK